jgi:hypothetical protein
MLVQTIMESPPPPPCDSPRGCDEAFGPSHCIPPQPCKKGFVPSVYSSNDVEQEQTEQEASSRCHGNKPFFLLSVTFNTATLQVISYNPDLEAPTAPLWWSRRELAYIQKRCRIEADSYCQSRPDYIASMIEVLKECRDGSKVTEYADAVDEAEGDDENNYRNNLSRHQEAAAATVSTEYNSATEHECAIGQADIRGLESRAFPLLRLARKKHSKSIQAMQEACRDWESVPDYAAFLLSVRSQQTSLFCRLLAVKMAAGDRHAATTITVYGTAFHDVIDY